MIRTAINLINLFGCCMGLDKKEVPFNIKYHLQGIALTQLFFYVCQNIFMKLIALFFLLMAGQLKAQYVNYVNYQSPVKSQHNRGTCSAFALLSAMEVLPGFPTDLSEQHAYALAKSMIYYKDSSHSYNEGATFADYLELLDDQGIVREDQMPYNPYMGFWDNARSSFEAYKADISGTTVNELIDGHPFGYTLEKDHSVYKEFADARDIQYIKSQLDSGVKNIPVGYFIESNYWSAHKGSRMKKMDPDDLIRFVINGKKLTYTEAKKINPRLEDDVLDGKLTYEMQNGYSNIFKGGHAVSIIGYDNNGFVLKNSWGKDWGENGYGWVSFNYHKLFVKRILVLKQGRIKIADDTDRGNDVKTNEIYLKSMPSGKNEKGMLVSLVYHGKEAPPSFKKITYKVIGRFNAAPIETVDGISIYSRFSFKPREYGYQAELLQKQLLLDFIYGYYIVAEMELENGRKITNTYYHVVPRNKEYEPNQY